MLKSIRLALTLSVITLTGFAVTPAMSASLKVVASFSIIGDFAKNVGGPRVEVTTIVGPNGDAHVYEPKPADAVAMAKADLVLVNGLHFEGFMRRLIDASASRGAVVVLSKGVTPITFKPESTEADEPADHEHSDHAHDAIDPHAFQSVPNARIYVTNIADAFCAADTEGCISYKINASSYIKKLDTLDAEIRQAIAAIPPEKRTVITSHDAFGYFEHEYGLTFLAPQGLATSSEPSAAEIAELVRQIRQDKVSAIFMENITNPVLIQQIVRETGIKVGGTLYSDALSPPDGPADTYIDMMRNNIRQIKSAISGD